ncbi:hypothetical protein Gpo141_00002666 [Globisporangium polare]
MSHRSASPRRRSASRSLSKSRRERSRSRSVSKKRRSRSPSRSRERDRSNGRRTLGSRSRSRERNDLRRERSRSRERGARGGAPGRHGGERGGGRPQPQSLLVRNLSPNTSPDRLRRAFSRREGDIRDIYLPKDYSTNQPRGFAFIEFNDSRDAREIKYQMDRSTFEGREIAVLFAQQRRKTPEEMRETPPSESPRDQRSR